MGGPTKSKLKRRMIGYRIMQERLASSSTATFNEYTPGEASCNEEDTEQGVYQENDANSEHENGIDNHSLDMEQDDYTALIDTASVQDIEEPYELSSLDELMEDTPLNLLDTNSSAEEFTELGAPPTAKVVLIGQSKEQHVNLTPRSHTRLQKMGPPANKIEGRRVITMTSLEAAINWGKDHGKICNESEIKIIREQRNGLETKVQVKCLYCKRKPVWLHLDTGTKSLPANDAFAWSANFTGVGYTGLKHAFTALDIPCPSSKGFQKCESQFAEQLSTAFVKQMEENGKEELMLALELNQTIATPTGPVPWTAVYCDGQWSKRSYNHQGTALSGSAALIGNLTRKPLFVATRNKFCRFCDKHKDSPNTPQHQCYKNFNDSSSAMEAHIILEGFSKSIQQHGLIYKILIGDGDSNVHHGIQNIYNNDACGNVQVQKIECKNHAIRRLNTHLNEIVKNKHINLADRNILKSRAPTIGRSCIYAIEINAARNSTSQILRRDLMNALNHSLGDHAACPSYLCVGGIPVVPPRLQRSDFQVPVRAPENKNVGPHNYVPELSKQPIWSDIKALIERLANLSDSLIFNFTSNIVESFQSSVCKLIQGKRINLVQRGGYTRRVHAAAFSFQFGQGWYYMAFKHIFSSDPSKLWKSRYNDGLRLKESCTRRKPVRKPKRALIKDYPKDEFFSKTRTAVGSRSYGHNISQPDLRPELLEILISELENALQITTIEQREEILKATSGQWGNNVFENRRKQMITASISGRVYSLRDCTSNVGILDSLLGPGMNHAPLRWGKEHEKDAIALYKKTYSCDVANSGMFVSLENGILGASPDGLVGDDGIVEVKCPYSARNQMLLAEVVKKCEYLIGSNDGSVQLKKSSHYYRQIVMQLHVSNRDWCDLVVWTQGPEENGVAVHREGFIVVVKITKSHETLDLWNAMLPKLVKFYREDFAPELKNSRFDRNMGYKQPKYRLEAIRINEARLAVKKNPKPINVTANEPKVHGPAKPPAKTIDAPAKPPTQAVITKEQFSIMIDEMLARPCNVASSHPPASSYGFSIVNVQAPSSSSGTKLMYVPGPTMFSDTDED